MGRFDLPMLLLSYFLLGLIWLLRCLFVALPLQRGRLHHRGDAHVGQLRELVGLLLHVGESDGEPRGTVGWWRQLRGYKAAIDAIASKRLRRIKSASDHNNDGNNATAPVGETLELSSAIDPTCIAAWGFSFTSSMALYLGIVDPRI